MESGYLTPESTIYRQVEDELVVIQLDTGHIYYFNPSTESFLDFFRAPRSFSDFLQTSKLDEGKDEAQYLERFLNTLYDMKLLQKADSQDTSVPPPLDYSRPLFLRKAERTLDEITFLEP